MTATPPSNQPASVPTMTPKRAKKPEKAGGGTATGGGINFQAAVTAIAGAHLLRGVPLGWLADADVPMAISAESDGAGDDLRLEIAPGVIAEIQAKKGLGRSSDLWKSIEAMVAALQSGELQHAALAVASDSSGTVKDQLPKDIRRLGEGRSDSLTPIGKALEARLIKLGGDWKGACERLRVRVVHALDADDHSIKHAKHLLRDLCAEESGVDAAWNAMYRDAVRLIEHRGRWTMQHLLRLLRREGVAIRDGGSAAAVTAKLSHWVIMKNNFFTVPAVRMKLPLSSLLDMKVVATTADTPEATDAAAAISRYHQNDDRAAVAEFDGDWIGRFKPKAVVLAGPGLGKSTLMKLLATRYAADEFTVLGVSLKPVAAAMAAGSSFEKALLEHALDGSGVQPSMLETARSDGLVVLADGLDECGSSHQTVAQAIRAFSEGHPSARIIVTTRPIGYTTSALSDWNHYRLVAPELVHGTANLVSLLEVLKPTDDRTKLFDWVHRELGDSEAGDAISGSPQLLCMAAAVICQKNKLPRSRSSLYAEFIGLYESGGSRPTSSTVTPVVLESVLNILGWHLIAAPLSKATDVERRCATVLAAELGTTQLAATERLTPALDYWETSGVIEKLHHEGVRYWTFVHKTFAEYCAARHLASRPAPDRSAELRTLLDQDAWHEVVDFGGGLGMGEEIAAALIEKGSQSTLEHLKQALVLCSSSEAGISADLIRRTAEVAFEILSKASSGRNFELGKFIADLALVHPGEVEPIAQRNLDCLNDAVRLTAWACVCGVTPARYTAADLAAAVDAILPRISVGLRTTLLGALSLRAGDSDRVLVSRVALAALAAHSDADCAALAVRWFGHKCFQSQAFHRSVEALLESRNIPPINVEWKQRHSLAMALMNATNWVEEAGKNWRVVLEAVASQGTGSLSQSNQSTRPSGPHIQLGALVAASCLRDMPDDFECWERPYDKQLVRDVLGALVSASCVDGSELADEASEFFDAGKSDVDFGRHYSDLPRVDAPTPDWKKAALQIADRERLAAAMNLGSMGMAYLAGNMLSELQSTPREAADLLRRSAGYGLWAAVQIVAAQHEKAANGMFVDVLVHPLPSGADHLFLALQERTVEYSPALCEAIQLGLKSSSTRVAIAAAGVASSVASRGGAIDPSVILTAYADWKTREIKPQGKAIPESPREGLLKTLIGLSAVTDDMLLEALVDPHDGVGKLAIAQAHERINLSDQFRQAIVERIAAQALKSQVVANLLEQVPPLSAQQVRRLEPLLSSTDPKWRRACVDLLSQPNMEPARLQEYLTTLAVDPEEEIRQIVARAAVRLTESTSRR